MVGVLHAARGFDPSQGTPFGGYAAPFVMGEMLACVRQLATPVRVPRSVADAERAVNRSIEELTMRDGRSPSPDEIAAHSGLEPDMVLEALRARMASTAVGLDEQEAADPSAPDPSLQEVEQRLDLGARLDRLDARSRRAVVLRFGLELSQREIAERLGISQMHVSRLLRAAMVTLADEGEDGDAVRT